MWVLTEWCRGWVFSGMGWLAVGYSQTDSWLMGFAPIGGIHTMSWGVLVTAGGLVTVLREPMRAKQLALFAIAVITSYSIHYTKLYEIGPAGTGKTYLAVAASVEALDTDAVRRIILVRPAVEAGEKLGFLPGDMSQKVDPYLRPMYDALYESYNFV